MTSLGVWDNFVEFVCEKIKQHPRLACFCDAITKDNVENYLAFYALNGGLFVCSNSECLTGVMTVHPGKKDLDWSWDDCDGTYTVNMVWAVDKAALSNLTVQGFSRFPAKHVFACRDNKLIELTPKTIKRVFTYGKH